MALLCSNSLYPFTLSYPSSSSSSTLAISSTAVHRLSRKPGVPHSKSLAGLKIYTHFTSKKKRAFWVVRAESDGDGGATPAPTDGGEPSAADTREGDVPVDKLPLESKLKERQEQRLKMKLAKKIRLRRKRLVRKRKLRKKGRWPPSKMNKLKNV